MKKILVTTDFSDNSVAGLRFAIQLAAQAGDNLELLFLHVPEPEFRNNVYEDTESSGAGRYEQKEKELGDFVRGVYQSMNVVPGAYRCVVHYHFGIALSIIDCAVASQCEYICISTHGAGKIKKYLGTNTGELIRQSPVPVLCIPRDYTPSPVSSVLYASDLENYEEEIARAVAFGTLAGADVKVVHFARQEAEDTVVDALRSTSQHDIQFHWLKRDISRSLLEELDEAVASLRPSVLIMFTRQNRSFFDNLFLSSKTEGYSFSTKVPLLAFSKG